jgi:hypothetical protein
VKLTKAKLQQIIKEEIEKLYKIDEAAGFTPGLGGAVPSEDEWGKEPTPESTTELPGPRKEDVIQAAMLLDINPDSARNRMVLYNVGMLLRNEKDPSPQTIVKTVLDAWEEDKLVGGDESLEETLKRLKII